MFTNNQLRNTFKYCETVEIHIKSYKEWEEVACCCVISIELWGCWKMHIRNGEPNQSAWLCKYRLARCMIGVVINEKGGDCYKYVFILSLMPTRLIQKYTGSRVLGIKVMFWSRTFMLWSRRVLCIVVSIGVYQKTLSCIGQWSRCFFLVQSFLVVFVFGLD